MELKKTNPDNYYGIDPSKSMLDRFIEKHPTFRYRLENSIFEDSHLSLNSFDYIVSLFGSISYVAPECLSRISFSCPHHFLMFYKPDYTPVTYQRANVSFSHYCLTKEELKDIFCSSDVREYNNYIIVSK